MRALFKVAATVPESDDTQQSAEAKRLARLALGGGPTVAVARKELRLFFGSPIGYLFLLTFLGFVLFVFFWGEAFFTRNIADVRPMFEWLPIFLIFLSAALTMRMWSEERRAGTLEFVLTVPTQPGQFVIGKFLACWALLCIALLLTLPLPIVVAIISNMDWGPVFAGYLAASLLGATYLAIGLYVSARTDNQIVSLIVSVLICGLLYIIGQPLVTDLFNYTGADFLRALGTGSRFESITRGLLDVRDLYYYISICGIFLVLNVTTLRTSGRADGWSANKSHTKLYAKTTLAVLNLVLVNVWLSQLGGLRADLTEGNRYTISPATKTYLEQLREPLLIRGYFSAKTHPLLAPLGPELMDLLREYELASDGKARLEIVDPEKEPEMEDEANEKYGIRPVPFKISDRYQASVVNSYFDVLLAYGDQYEVLSFRDLIEYKAQSEERVDVRLRNPEFDITRAIKKVIQNFQSSGSVFDNLQSAVHFRGYISEGQRLPESLVQTRKSLQKVLSELAAASKRRFTFEIIAPEAEGGVVAAQIKEQYGFSPMAVDLFSKERFHFYMTLTDGETLVQVPLPEARGEEGLRVVLQEGLKRFASGLLQKVALRVPKGNPGGAPGAGGAPQRQAPTTSYQGLGRALINDFKVELDTSLSRQNPAIDTQVLILMNPKELGEYELFLMDQFLMRGGTLILASSAFDVTISQNISAFPKQTGLEEWLAYQGVSIDKQFVLDTQNARYPVPVQQKVGAFLFNRIQMLDYPYFIDLRESGLNQEVLPLTTLPQLTFSWASPIDVDEEVNRDREVTPLLESSSQSWRSAEVAVMPTTDGQNSQGFAQPQGNRGAQQLGVMIEGRFESFFEDAPLPPEPPAEPSADQGDDEDAPADPINLVSFSSPKARLIVFGSGDFVSDQVLNTASAASGTAYNNPLQLMVNLVDWSVEDLVLLSIRNRSHFNRTLPPMERAQQQRWEYLSYLLAGVGLLIVFLINLQKSWVRQNRQSAWLHEVAREDRGDGL